MMLMEGVMKGFNMELSRICKDCSIEKPIEEFSICSSKGGKTWRLRFCKKCSWVRRKSSDNPSNYYYEKNRDAWNTYQREYAKKKYWENKNKI